MPILEIVALITAAVAVLVAWRALVEIKTLTSKLDRLQSAVYETRREQRARQEQTENKLAVLEVSLQKATGKLRFDPNASLTQLYEIEPRAQSVLAAFHIGGCAGCAVDENGTLADAVRERGADLDRVLAALNTLPAHGGHADLRVPNVHFDS